MSKPYNSKLTDRAKELRNNATKYENHLWYDFLSTYRPRFQRQKPIGNYIVDFYCFKAGLAVELDGSQHYEDKDKKYDEQRTNDLRERGIEVIRFTNLDIANNFDGVCETIDLAVKKRIKEQNYL